jgi:peroxidase
LLKLLKTGRDHGLPTYLQTRAKCGLKSNFKTFDDLIEIFPQSYIELLKPEYESVEDIDLVVGGSLESFLSVDSTLVGETFDCIIRDQFKRTMAGDAYWFTNQNQTYPFTTAQIATIKDFSFNSLVCLNTGLQSVPSSVFYVENDLENNSKVNCTQYKPMNLQAWKNV